MRTSLEFALVHTWHLEQEEKPIEKITAMDAANSNFFILFFLVKCEY